ncbi:hypothetical protein [Shivajiella indica]|uniref:PepSY domain-containing protein n=1 Tax=Shivajiella indica TaxID=872115 RepID=A0ABW5B9B8_9BACT
MKKQLLITAIFMLGLFVSPLMSMPIPSLKESLDFINDQEKVQLDPNHLPEKVKNTIENNEEIKDLPITQAWQIIEEDGTSHFKVKFDIGGEELIKIYDPEGKEIID